MWFLNVFELSFENLYNILLSSFPSPKSFRAWGLHWSAVDLCSAKKIFFPSSYQLPIAFWLAYNFVSTFVRSFSETEPHVPWLTS